MCFIKVHTVVLSEFVNWVVFNVKLLLNLLPCICFYVKKYFAYLGYFVLFYASD